MQAVKMHTGKVVHAGVAAGTREGYQLWKPLCGFGRRSLTYAGPVDAPVTCQKCLNRQAQLAARAGK